MQGPGRFVAIGDSFTEGVGDLNPTLPNGVRGWADRVADRLARHQPGWQYANLAVRSKRLRQIDADQVPAAIALRPTLITVYAGGNDLLDVGTDVAALMVEYEAMVRDLAATGATLVLFTGYDIVAHPALKVFLRRNRLYNDEVRRIAREVGAVLIDYWRFEEYANPRMWAPDRLHMSKRGHKRLAARVLDALDVPHTISAGPWDPPAPRSAREWLRDQHRWTVDWLLPLVGRKLRRVTLGDTLSPRWPHLVTVPPKGGTRRLT
ncbi:SGNH/GDSL hydrolase family protein [Herbiconiux sp. L3-i23]|uniref:SGNH/GDSL hydrolase family protein n=1 Tax=Herbiconiux sp. L3-i23 TaxID=2905871 RepID=UPI002048D8DB|nr:SGNH/GDSL hydrolase family protein [Herbiconiux sp. L3-i23]BDI21763.1 SGNH hydrolase [Herbiconiux sp. L3-i23]